MFRFTLGVYENIKPGCAASLYPMGLFNSLQDPHFGLQSFAKSVSFQLQFVAGLKIEPEFTGGPEKTRQTQRGVWRYGAFPVHNLVNSTRRNRNVFRKSILTDSQRVQEFLEQDFSRMNRWHCGGRHKYLIMGPGFP